MKTVRKDIGSEAPRSDAEVSQAGDGGSELSAALLAIPIGTHSARLDRILSNLLAHIESDGGHSKDDRLLHIVSRIGDFSRPLAEALRNGSVSASEVATLLEHLGDIGELAFRNWMSSADATSQEIIPDQVQQRVAQAVFGKKVITNVLRGQVVETIIAFALEPEWYWCAAGYASWDFERADGLRLEVKQSSATQTWLNDAPSRGSFDIAPRKRRFEAEGWIYEERRAAHLYVFAWHPVTDESADHRDPGQWEFYVIATTDLPATKTIGLAGARRLAEPCLFADLASRVAAVAARVREN